MPQCIPVLSVNWGLKSSREPLSPMAEQLIEVQQIKLSGKELFPWDKLKWLLPC